VWTKFIWHMLGTTDRLLSKQEWTLWFHKWQGISSSFEWLSALWSWLCNKLYGGL
jgi:hypothetical protein